MPGKIDRAPAASNPDTNTDDSDETSEEEATEEEEVEDQEQGEEETDESEETEEEEEESTEEESEEEVEDESKQYIDLKTVPAQLQVAAKKMLASHTKAMQKASAKVEAEIERRTGELEQQYQQAIVQSAAFNKIITWPDWNKFYEDSQAGRPYGYSSSFRSNGESKSKGDSSVESDGKVSADSIMKELTPAILKIVNGAIDPIRQNSAKALWDSAEKNLPNFNKYRTQITSIMTQNPTLTLEQAYKLAKPDNDKEAVQKVIDDSKKIAKKLPKTLKPSGGGSRPLSDKVVKSVDDALNLAKRDLVGGRSGR